MVLGSPVERSERDERKRPTRQPANRRIVVIALAIIFVRLAADIYPSWRVLRGVSHDGFCTSTWMCELGHECLVSSVQAGVRLFASGHR